MEITIKNCNNIKDGKISIEKNKLNIKYGINGTGKSTIALAVEHYINNKPLKFLQSFGIDDEPKLTISEQIKKVVTFNSDFINDIVFIGDDIINNSFEVFIKSAQYDETIKNISDELKELKTKINDDIKIKNLIKILSDHQNSLKLTQDCINIFRTNEFKSILKKDSIYKIPDELKHYELFLTDKEKNTEWIAWKTAGFKYDDKDICPFCAVKLKSEYNDEKMKFNETYKKKDTENLIKMKSLIENLKDYMSEDKFDKLQSCITENKSEDTINDVFKPFISEFQDINKNFENINNFDSYSNVSNNISDLDNIVKGLKFKINNFTYFNSEKFISICNTINEIITNILKKIKKLKEEFGQKNNIIKSAIENSKNEINEFLKIAGFDYEIKIEVKNDNQAKTMLTYCKKPNNIVTNIKHHLSWGEKNAFAMVLFMYYALSQNADLIILDDPISSFDDNKKYAIINRLFSKSDKLKNKTVLMLTHDLEPIIDFQVIGKPYNDSDKLKISYIKNKNGTIEEKSIEKDDIKLIIKQYYEYINNDELNIISRISFLRKYIELSNIENNTDMINAYNILSSLIHRNEKIQRKKGHDNYEDMSKNEINSGISFIKKFIKNFQYREILNNYYTEKSILELYEKEENNYLKTQIFREYLEISNKRDKLSNEILKFVDETYHIENDYIYSLDLIKFDTIPNFIIDKINDFMEDEKKKM